MAYTLLHDSSGAAVSIGTKVASPLPPGLTAVALADQEAADLLGGRAAWDAATRGLVVVLPSPAEMTADEKLAEAKAVLDQITALPAPVLTADVVDLLDDLRGVL